MQRRSPIQIEQAHAMNMGVLFRTSSSIRTLTVGPGISPDLLTLACRCMRGARGLTGAKHIARIPPVGNSTPP